jgi:hypothetical protein
MSGRAMLSLFQRWNRRPRTPLGKGTRKSGRESGFAYLMALFLVFSIIVGSQVAVQSLLTMGRRDKEADMIWRGNQYVRAIRLYYHKTGHYPQTIDDLEKGLPDLHFLRLAAYKEPMNTEDGSWRFIYVNGAGQIIGSVKYASLQQMAFLDLNNGKPPTPVVEGAVSASSLASESSGTNSSSSAGSTTTSSGLSTSSGAPADSSQSASPSAPTDTSGASAGSQPPGSGQSVGGNSSSTTTTSPTSAAGPGAGSTSGPGGLSGLSGMAANSPIAQQKPTGPVDGPVLGGFLTGVGSKVDRSSVKVYKGAKKYNEFEFIWNPLEDQARAVQQGLSGGATSGTPGSGLSGASPIGGASGAGTGTGFGSSPMGGAGGLLGGGQPGTPIGSSSPQPQSQP